MHWPKGDSSYITLLVATISLWATACQLLPKPSGLLAEITIAWPQFILGGWLQTHQSLEQRSSELVTFTVPFSVLSNNASYSELQPTVHTGMPQTFLNLGVFKSVVVQIPPQWVWFGPQQQLLHWGKCLWLQRSFGSRRQKKQALCIWLRCSGLLPKWN